MRAFGPAPLRTPLAALVAMALAGCGRDGAGPGAPAEPTPVAVPPEPAPPAEPPAAPDATPVVAPTPVSPVRAARLPTPIPTSLPEPEALSEASRTAYELARTHGKPLLAVLSPASVEERRRRARLFEQLLRPPSIRAVLALADVAFVPEADAVAFGLPSAAVPIAFGVLVETDGSGHRPTALPVANVLRVHAAEMSTSPLPSVDEGIEVLERLERSELDALFRDRGRTRFDGVDLQAATDAFYLFLSTVREAIVGPHLARRVAAARQVESRDAADGAVSAVERGIRLHPEDAHRLAAIVYAAGLARPKEQAATIELLARAAAFHLLFADPPGARWVGRVRHGPTDWCGTPHSRESSPMLVLLPPEGG